MSVETRMADFIGRLIEETLEAVQSAHLEQSERITAAMVAAQTPLADLAKAISPAQVKAAQAARPVLKRLSAEQVRLALAEEQIALLRTTLESGLPRLVIDEGEISARTTFKLETPAAAPAGVGLRTAQPDVLRQALTSRLPAVSARQIGITLSPVTAAGAGASTAEHLAEFNVSLKFRVIS